MVCQHNSLLKLGFTILYIRYSSQGSHLWSETNSGRHYGRELWNGLKKPRAPMTPRNLHDMFLVKCQLTPEMVNKTCKYYILCVPRCNWKNVFGKVKGKFSSFCSLYTFEIFLPSCTKKDKIKKDN
jgi:hypothetical protein